MTTIAPYTKKFVRYLRNTRGVSALEYAILVGIIAVAIAAALTTFSGEITDAMNTIGEDIGGIAGPGNARSRRLNNTASPLNKVCRFSTPGTGRFWRRCITMPRV